MRIPAVSIWHLKIDFSGGVVDAAEFVNLDSMIEGEVNGYIEDTITEELYKKVIILKADVEYMKLGDDLIAIIKVYFTHEIDL